MHKTTRYLLILLCTPLFFILAMWLSALPHEYAHATAAWLYGFKLNPLDIYYGQFNWQNIVFVASIDEHVNYYLISLFNQPHAIGAIAFAGPVVTLIIYLLSLCLLQWQRINKHPFWFYFIAWILCINLSELLSYVILRAFSAHGDMGHIVFGWGISPWWIFSVGGAFVCLGLWHFFRNILPKLYSALNLDATAAKVILLFLFVWILFGVSGIRMFLTAYGLLAKSLGTVFLISIPLIIFFCWPSRRWVLQKMRKPL